MVPLGHPLTAGDYRPLSVRIQLPGARFVGQTGKSVGVPVRCGPCDKAAGAGAHIAPSLWWVRRRHSAVCWCRRALTAERRFQVRAETPPPAS